MSDAVSVTVQFPKEMADRIRQRAHALQFHDIAFYVRWLVAKDAAPDADEADLAMALVNESMNSGESRAFDDALKRELTERTDRIIEAKAALKPNRAAG